MSWEIEAIAEVLSEQVGFGRESVNPDTKGWQDIVAFLLDDPVLKQRLIERFGDRVTEYADRVDEVYDQHTQECRHDEAEHQHDSRLDRHYFELAQALARQEARKLTEGRS